MAAGPASRIPLVDIARGAALLAMAVYHFAWDMEFFGYAEPGMTSEGGWRLFARGIASTFLFLVGVSLVLGHGEGVRWKPFRRRWLMVAGAAAAITLATRLAMPESFIFFGILHQIALASLLGLAFLRLPAALTLAIAAAFIAAPHWLRSSLFDAPPLWWVGLSATIPRSNDYVPLFPWFGAVLIGIAAGRAAAAAGLFEWLGRVRAPRWAAPAGFAGRHSLAFYLVHQPVLIAALWLFAQVAPPQPVSQQERFVSSCSRTCTAEWDAPFCSRYCACVLDRLVGENRLDDAFGEGHNAETLRWLGDVAGQCTREAAAGEGEP